MTEFVNSRHIRRSLWFAWFLCPLAVVVWHFGPGQNQYARDLAGDHVDLGNEAADQQQFHVSAHRFAAALAALPEDDQDTSTHLQLEHACRRIRAGEMVEGQEELMNVLQDLESRDRLSSDLAASVRHELASASYYTAWLMRLEGATAREWKPESERARQHFRLLAEQYDGKDAQRSEQFQKNLEATIRLEQMDLNVLMAKPLPKNCPNCCKNLSQRKRKQCQSRCKGNKNPKEGKKKQHKDARQQIKEQQGAGLNEMDGNGS